MCPSVAERAREYRVIVRKHPSQILIDLGHSSLTLVALRVAVPNTAVLGTADLLGRFVAGLR